MKFIKETKADKKTINEHDKTKDMLKFMRESMGEQGVMPNMEVSQDVGDGDSMELSGAERKAEEDKFADIVTPRVEFGKFLIYPQDNNVVWSGTLSNGIKWKMSKNDDLVIDASNVVIDDEEMEMISRLKKYEDNWVDDWSTKLRTDYKAERNAE